MGVPSRPSRHLGLALSGALAALLAAAPPLATRTAVKTLAAEAKRHREEPASLPSAPDFASRADPALEIDHDDLVATLTQRVVRDPFTDAYIRWQLSSLDPDLDSIDAKTFARLVRDAPVPAPNPRADDQVVMIFERVADAGPLRNSDLKRFRALLERLETETVHAQAMGRPATGFHDWVQKKVAPHPLRSRQWMLVRLAMAASAGWPVNQLKSQVSWVSIPVGHNDPACIRTRTRNRTPP